MKALTKTDFNFPGQKSVASFRQNPEYPSPTD